MEGPLDCRAEGPFNFDAFFRAFRETFASFVCGCPIPPSASCLLFGCARG